MAMGRKGARRRSEIPAEVLRGLNDGTLETANLVEGLAVDFRKLLKVVAPELPPNVLATLDPADGITRRMAAAGRLLQERLGLGGLERLIGHTSDTVRGWGAYAVAHGPGLTLKQRLEQIQPLADDPHFGVREWAWLAVRPQIAEDIRLSLKTLQSWTRQKSANLRRFAIEVTRPRGVWCRHIDTLKAEPELGLPLLTRLNADPSKYVQDSVANWLNDASKSQPEWVRAVCDSWQNGSDEAATLRICQRATRSLE
jgi:3-methyladenine DNA glycosylase AlkC